MSNGFCVDLFSFDTRLKSLFCFRFSLVWGAPPLPFIKLHTCLTNLALKRIGRQFQNEYSSPTTTWVLWLALLTYSVLFHSKLPECSSHFNKSKHTIIIMMAVINHYDGYNQWRNEAKCRPRSTIKFPHLSPPKIACKN